MTNDMPLQRQPKFTIATERGVYHATWQATDVPQAFDAAKHWVLSTYDNPNGGPLSFNYGVRRHPSTLVSGDTPRFALVIRKDLDNAIQPPWEKLGDLRIRLRRGTDTYWLDQHGTIHTEYHPWGTRHACDLGDTLGWRFTIEAAMTDGQGCCVVLRPLPCDGAQSITLELLFGGLAVTGPLYTTYITSNSEHEGDNIIALDGLDATLSSPAVERAIRVSFSKPALLDVVENDEPAGIRKRLRASYELAPGSAPREVRITARIAEAPPAPQGEPIAAAKAYYHAILERYAMRSPDEVLDAAFNSACVNMDYLYGYPMWLEGIEQWEAPWTNNYQISAGIGLGQFDRARDTLLDAANCPEGPTTVMTSRHQAYTDAAPEDGLFYYAVQLHRYWRATRDEALVRQVWDGLVRNIERTLVVRDTDGDGVLDYHLACNAFLYQADHLSLPGCSASPTLMMIDVLNRSAELAEMLGEADRAADWRRRAEHMQRECMRRLWLHDEARFASAVDSQGLTHRAAYYTDYVFPVLHGGMSDTVGWLCLQSLDRDLALDPYRVRVGNYMPLLFGNSAVHTAQQAEMAEAFCQAGAAERAWQLMHGVALSSTLLTDSPGNVPEFMSDKGWAMYNFIFGNCVGAFVHAAIAGMWGLQRSAESQTVQWQPALPAEWDLAEMRVDDITMSIAGAQADRTYRIALPRAQAVRLRVPLGGRAVKAVVLGPETELAYTTLASPTGGFAFMDLPDAREHQVRVTLGEADTLDETTIMANADRTIRHALGASAKAIDDPQRALAHFRIDDGVLTGTVAPWVGEATIFARYTDQPTVQSLRISVPMPTQERPAPPSTQDGEMSVADVSAHLVDNALPKCNLWNYEGATFDFSAFAEPTADHAGWGRLRVGDTPFEVRLQGDNLALLSVGALDANTHRLALSSQPTSLTLPIGKHVASIRLLSSSEGRTRLTHMRVGTLAIRYADGYIDEQPLIYGTNLDCSQMPFASAATALNLGDRVNVYASTFPADATREARDVTINLFTPDISLAVFAVTLEIVQ